ncbi:uncharacterized protein LOC128204760 [Mya arenaria]|uniref:uncharacterized protein LOC128204760 n=1 Tax=Mya arenaria TaxID=6604 RepID=UPI0022E22EBF|nr:uncharacterized protein LOC128204760 [Mya arenaria]
MTCFISRAVLTLITCLQLSDICADAFTYHVAFLGTGMYKLQDTFARITFSVEGGMYTVPMLTTAVGSCSPVDHYNEHADTNHIYSFTNSSGCIELLPSGVGIFRSAVKVELDNAALGTTVHVVDDSTYIDDRAYLAIPDEYLGTDYYVVTYCAFDGICQFAITPVENNTLVTVVFPKDLVGVVNCDSLNVSAGEPLVFLLDEFDVLHFESVSDFSGTHVQSDKNVGVVVGARNISTGFMDIYGSMMEQITPVNRWGKNFVVAPNPANDAGDFVKIVTKADNTKVQITGYSPFIVAQAGSAVEWRIDWGMNSLIEVSLPVMVIQIMSVNLYNDTADVMGTPSMLLVPSLSQWTYNTVVNPCNSTATVVSSSYYDVIPSASENETIDLVEATNITIKSFPNTNAKTFVTILGSFTTYAVCGETSAFPLDVDWMAESEDCGTSVSFPGDGVDNDCDGQTDEDVCTAAGLGIQFNAENNFTTGKQTTRTIHVQGASYFPYTVSTCSSVAHLTFLTESQDIYTSIQVLDDDVLVTSCDPECFLVLNVSDTRGVTCAPRTFILEQVHDDVTKTTFNKLTLPGLTSKNWTSLTNLYYNDLILSSLVGQSNFTLQFSDKDCGKIYSGAGVPNNFGTEFIIPTSPDFDLYITSGTNGATVSYGNGSLVIAPTSTKTLCRAEVENSINANEQLYITSTFEVSVYMVEHAETPATAYRILPNDILGPSYLIFPGTMCYVHAFMAPVNMDHLNIHISFQNYQMGE